MIKQYVRALDIPNSQVLLEVNEKDFLQFAVINETDEHTVSCDEGIWRCTCEDYQFKKDKHLGSYTCKHILKSILYLRDRDFHHQTVLEEF